MFEIALNDPPNTKILVTDSCLLDDSNNLSKGLLAKIRKVDHINICNAITAP